MNKGFFAFVKTVADKQKENETLVVTDKPNVATEIGEKAAKSLFAAGLVLMAKSLIDAIVSSVVTAKKDDD